MFKLQPKWLFVSIFPAVKIEHTLNKKKYLYKYRKF